MKEREPDTLSAVIETEREIQSALEAERKKVSDWIECVKGDEERRIVEEEERLKAWAADALAGAEAEAAARAEAVINQARRISQMLSRMDDASIRRLLSRRLAAILPDEKT